MLSQNEFSSSYIHSFSASVSSRQFARFFKLVGLKYRGHGMRPRSHSFIDAVARGEAAGLPFRGRLLRYQTAVQVSALDWSISCNPKHNTNTPEHFQLQRKFYPRKCAYYKGLETQPGLFHEHRATRQSTEFSAI